jgi:hypothetical protein
VFETSKQFDEGLKRGRMDVEIPEMKELVL